MRSAAEYIAEADGSVSLCSTAQQAKHAGANFGCRWAHDVLAWERRDGQQPGNRRCAVQAALLAEMQGVPLGSLTHSFYDVAYAAFTMEAP